jgi:hypothetical protein
MEFVANLVDEGKIILGKSINIAPFLHIRQPTVQEILDFGEKRYFSLVHTLTAEPFDMPYYLDQMGINFEEITGFDLFLISIRRISKREISFLFGDIDFENFKIVQREYDVILVNNKGQIIDSGIREKIAENLRRIHCLPKNNLTSCYNNFAHKLMIQMQKREIEQSQKRIELFGEHSQFVALVSSLACEWKSYENVLRLPIAQFFDAVIRSGYKETSNLLYSAMYSGSLKPDSYNKKDLDWRRPVKIKAV